jgi:squalene-hopene/tetraprenyl-beta-curcumene cyclase
MMNRIRVSLVVAGVMVMPLAHCAFADDKPTTAPTALIAAPQGETATLATATVDKAFDYLKKAQKPDNSWQGPSDPPAITALVLRCYMADERYDADMPFLEKGFANLLTNQLDNGGIYKDALAVYNTAIAVSALAISKEAEYKPQLDKAVAFLKTQQWTDSIVGHIDPQPAVTDADANYGGFGYGKAARADLSNTQMALDALHDAGLKPDDAAYKAAIKFATRTQNLSETNDQKWSGDDGGFVYTPSKGGFSMAGEYTGPDGRKMLRSYGSMTYAGLKSMIYAGLSKDDQRVKAAWAWISKNYTVDENPGMSFNGPEAAKGGLFYYYMTMARALHAYGEPMIADANGNQHDWRIDLTTKLASLQAADGSFKGDRKWMEDNAVLATSYVALALEEIRADLKDHPAK